MDIEQKACTTEVENVVCELRSTFNDELPLLKAIRTFPRITLYTLGVMGGILFVGYDTVIIGSVTAIPRFQYDFGEPNPKSVYGRVLPATWVALWSAFGPIGAVLGGIFGGWFQERVGRKLSLASGSAIAIVAIAVMYCCNLADAVEARRSVFLVSKLLQGGSVGIILSTSQSYVSEITPVSLRGPAMALFPTFILLGQLAGAVAIFAMIKVETPRSYLIPFASQWPFAVLPLVMSFLIPQSPNWLLQRERTEEAQKSLSKLLKSSDDASLVLEQMKASVTLDKQVAAETSYIDCFKGVDRRRTMIVIVASSIPNFFGVPLMSSTSYFLQQVGMSAFNSLMLLIIGIVLGALANGVGIWMMSKLGRRLLTLSSLSVSTVLWVGMGISGIWQNNVTIWYTAVTLMVIVVVCGISCWPAGSAVSVEAAPLRLRARSQGISVLASQVGNIAFQLVLPYIYNSDAGDLKSKLGFVYAGVCAIGTILCWFVIPEMKGRTTADIDRLFETRVPTRAFKSH